MSKSAEKTKRPTSITVVRVVIFIAGLITVPSIFSSKAQQVGSWFPPFLGFSVVLMVACVIGLWMMRKWAAYTYIGFVAVNQVVLIAMGLWYYVATLIHAIFIFFILKKVSKMT